MSAEDIVRGWKDPEFRSGAHPAGEISLWWPVDIATDPWPTTWNPEFQDPMSA